MLDLDQIEANARLFGSEAARLGLTTFPMTKQLGNNPPLLQALARAELPRFVAVDMNGARRIHTTGHLLGHIGHLVQVPRHEAGAAAAMRPAYWTLYSEGKAREASHATNGLGEMQHVLLRIFGPGDTFYAGHEGGFPAQDVLKAADLVDSLPGLSFAGVTSFPALLFDEATGTVQPTHNLSTLASSAEALVAAGQDVVINAPGTTSVDVLQTLASAGATQVEPGHGLTGTTPLHAVRDLPEVPAALYLTEVSHLHGGKAYCFGGGMYIDPVFQPYQVRALVGRDLDQGLATRVDAWLPPPAAIDYYGTLDVPDHAKLAEGDSVVFGFRIQAFVTQAFVAPVAGLHRSRPEVRGIWWSDGSPASWPS